LEKISRIKEDILRAFLAQLQLHEFLEMVIHSSSLEIMTGSTPAFSIKKYKTSLGLLAWKEVFGAQQGLPNSRS